MSRGGRDEFERAQPTRVILRRILVLAKPYWRLVVGGVALGLGISGLGLVTPFFMGAGVNRLLESLKGSGPGWERFAPVVQVAVAIAIISAAGIALSYANRILMAHLRMRILTDLRRRIYRKLLRQSFSYYDKQDTGQLINRTIGDVNMLRMFYTMVLVQGALAAWSVVGYMIALMVLDRYVAMVALPFVPLYVTFVILFARRIHPLFHDMRDELDRSTTILSESVQGVQVVRAFAREPEEQARYETSIGAILAKWVGLSKSFATFLPAVFLIGNFSVLGMVAMTSYRVLYGPLAVGAILTVFRLARILTNQGRSIARMTGALEHSLVSAERIFEILDARPEIRAAEGAQALPKGRGHVVFDHVTFGYDAEHPILQDVTVDIPPGTNVALVGPTGSGKSTFIKLLPRFYGPQQGRILIDGVDIREVGLQELRSEIGFVFQDTFLFSASLAENIAYGVPEAEQRAIEDAARRARVDEFAQAFEDGYDTRVGERGITLSGGQRQRVAIARALLTDPRILILDDATASVDSSTERAIQDALAEVMEDRTTFIIAHRASTVKQADLILVVEDGRVIQEGTHEELLSREGPYQEFVRMQLELGVEEKGAAE